MTKEVIPNFQYISAHAYSKHTGIGYETVLLLCKRGELDAVQTDGGRWKIKIKPEDSVSREEYEALRRENAELRAKLEGIRRLAV